MGLVFKALLRVSSLKHILRTEINSFIISFIITIESLTLNQISNVRPGEKQTLLALAEDRQDMNIVGKIINKYY